MKPTSNFAIACGVLFAAIAFHGVHAQTQPPKVMTRDELRACMNTESELTARRKAIEELKSKTIAESAEILAEGVQLAEDLKRGEDSQIRKDRLERRTKAHNARLTAGQAAEESVRADVEALNKAVTAKNEGCGSLAFNIEDRDAILKEREAMKK